MIIQVQHANSPEGEKAIEGLLSRFETGDDSCTQAVTEIIAIGREAGVPVHISHIKLAMTGMWGRAQALISRLPGLRHVGG